MRIGKRKFHAENQSLDGHFHKKYSRKINKAERQFGKKEVKRELEHERKTRK